MRLDGSRDTRQVRLPLRAALGVVLAAALIAGLLAGCGSSSPSLASINPTEAPHNAGWLYVGRDRDNTRYTPQKQINTETAKHLGVAWSTSLGLDAVSARRTSRSSSAIRSMRRHPRTSVEAINATTGKIEWTYAPEVNFSFTTGVGGLGVSTNRGVAISNGHLFLVTFDDKLQSISASTGEELWSSEVVNPETGVFEDMSPTVYDGMVFVGGSGGEDGVRGFISAFSERAARSCGRPTRSRRPAKAGCARRNAAAGPCTTPPRSTPRRASCTWARARRRPRCSAKSARGPTSTPPRSSRSRPRRARCSGTTRRCPTTCTATAPNSP